VTMLQIVKCLCCKWYVNLHFFYLIWFQHHQEASSWRRWCPRPERCSTKRRRTM
jgi:hypothetical protein